MAVMNCTREATWHGAPIVTGATSSSRQVAEPELADAAAKRRQTWRRTLR